jgi:hypothetical protein
VRTRCSSERAGLTVYHHRNGAARTSMKAARTTRLRTVCLTVVMSLSCADDRHGSSNGGQHTVADRRAK